jgi:hypothetical protein
VERGRLDAVCAVVEEPEETGMHDRDVVPLEIVVDVHLPVARDLVVHALAELHRRDGQVPGLLRDRAEKAREIRSRSVEVHEEKRTERLGPKGRKTVTGPVEVPHALPLGRAAEGSVETVGPAVVAALEDLPVAGAAGDRPRAVTADVRQRADRPVLGAREHERLPRDLAGEEVAGRSERVGVPDGLPRPAENAPALLAEDLGIEIPGRRDRRGPGEVGLEIVILWHHAPELRGFFPPDRAARRGCRGSASTPGPALARTRRERAFEDLQELLLSGVDPVRPPARLPEEPRVELLRQEGVLETFDRPLQDRTDELRIDVVPHLTALDAHPHEGHRAERILLDQEAIDLASQIEIARVVSDQPEAVRHPVLSEQPFRPFEPVAEGREEPLLDHVGRSVQVLRERPDGLPVGGEKQRFLAAEVLKDRALGDRELGGDVSMRAE